MPAIEVVLIHESAHCEQAALLFAHTAKLESNFAGHMVEVADGFKTTLPNGKVVDYSGSAKTMMWERYADSKAVLFLSKMHLGGLTDHSTDSERSAAMGEFKQDVSVMKKLRVLGRESTTKANGQFDDHDTLHIVDSLEATVVENAKDPAKWKAWSEKYLGDEQNGATAGSISLGSLLAERQEIAVNKISERADQLQSHIEFTQSNKREAMKGLEVREKEAEQFTRLFETEKVRGKKEHASLSPANYVSASNDARDTATKRILDARVEKDTGGPD